MVDNHSVKLVAPASGARVMGRPAVVSSFLHSLMAIGHVASRCSAVSCSLRHMTQDALCVHPFFLT